MARLVTTFCLGIIAVTFALGAKPGSAQEAAQALQSAYKPGEKIAPMLWEYRATGPRAGGEGSLLCTYYYQPVVVIYCRELDPPVVRLVKKLDQLTAKYTARPLPPYPGRLGSYLVLCCESKDRATELKALGEKEKIQHLILSLVVMKDGSALHTKLGEAETTVLLVGPRAVVKASYAFRKNELNDESIAQVFATLPAIIDDKPKEGGDKPAPGNELFQSHRR